METFFSLAGKPLYPFRQPLHEADESWRDKLVKNPETGNEVKVSSLPPEEQERYRPKAAAAKPKLAIAPPPKDDAPKSVTGTSMDHAKSYAAQASKHVEKASGGDWKVDVNAKGRQVWVHKSGKSYRAPRRASIDNVDANVKKMNAQLAADQSKAKGKAQSKEHGDKIADLQAQLAAVQAKKAALMKGEAICRGIPTILETE